jgi:hypothetical protein
MNATETITGTLTAAVARYDDGDHGAYDETVALTRALAAVRSRTSPDIKAKVITIAGSTAITAEMVEALPPEDRELVASILRDALTLD